MMASLTVSREPVEAISVKPTFVDLSHPFYDAMPGFRMKGADGSPVEYSARIKPFLTHEASRPLYDGQAAFEITEVHFQTAVGTYLDSPYHRHKDRRDIGAIEISDVIAEGICVDLTGHSGGQEIGPAALPDQADLEGKALLLRFGWDTHFGTDAYFSYPFLSEKAIDYLSSARPALVGVDTCNIDDSSAPSRPAHTKLLREDILIVENLTALQKLPSTGFRFFAVPIKAKGAASMPVRAFAELRDGAS